jgi:surface antigen
MKIAIALSLALSGVVLLAGCGTTTGSRTASGALLGAGTGAAVGSMSANAGKGALIGAGAGALGGYLYDQDRKQRENEQYRDRNRYRTGDQDVW